MTVAEVLPMPTERRARLKELETVIASGFDGVVELGRALREIRDEGLYLEVGASNFEQYVKSRWAIAARTAYYQIDAADIQDAISAQIVQTPVLPITTEGVGRELSQILHQHGPAKVAEAWAKVSEAYAGQRPPTAREVHRILVAEGYREQALGPSSGKINRRVRLGQFGDKLLAADKRLDWFVAKELGDKPLGKNEQQLAASYADRCEAMARRLREMV